ncbi:MAG: carboxypeptidase M32 [Pseudomonadota bacterium]
MTDYQELEARHKRMSAIGGALSILGWDQSVIMPEGASQSRAEQVSALSLIIHEMQTAPDMGDLISAAENDGGLDEWQRANVREIRHDWLHATAVPADLVDRKIKARSASELTWRSARAEDDFAKLEPQLSELLTITREVAAVKAEAFGCSLYDALLDGFDPGRKSAEIDVLFDELMSFLPAMLDEVLAAQEAAPDILVPEGPFSTEAQEALGRKVMELFQFDFNHGRLDVSLHPFSGGTPDDSRITTRYADEDFTQSLMAVIHETGHAQYERGLPKAWRGQPVGQSRGMTVHESQSLLFEMLAARSPEFISYIAPELRETFGGSGPAWQNENLVRLYHKVERGLIRVDADEVTYPLHVILRYRLEKQMIEGDLAVKDLPEAFREGMRELVGVAPETDRDGCLQDIHWPSGAFGYFPTYTLGALGASQIFQAATKADDTIMSGIAKGDFSALLTWLRANIHGQASKLMPGALIEQATGAPLGTDAFKTHLKARYLRG